MIAVGGHFIEDMNECMICMATGLSGGIGVSFRDLCGALTAGVMVIGALHGRSNLSTDDAHCQEMAATYRNRFAEALGSVYCHELRAGTFGSQGQEPCSVLVE